GNPTNASGYYAMSDITVVYVYDKEDGPDPDPNGDKTVTVHYVNQAGDKIAEDDVLTGKYQDPYKTEAKDLSADGYTLKETPLNANGYFAMNPIEVTYVYQGEENTSAVRVKFVDLNGSKLDADETISGNVGDDYQTE